jgi:hypothetical protein
MALVLSAWRGAEVLRWTPRFVNQPQSQKISKLAEDMEQYSNSVEDLEIPSCFLHFQEMRESPKKYTNQLEIFSIWASNPICICKTIMVKGRAGREK